MPYPTPTGYPADKEGSPTVSVRLLDAFVAPLDRTTLGCQRAPPAATGRLADAPAALCKRYISGYL